MDLKQSVGCDRRCIWPSAITGLLWVSYRLVTQVMHVKLAIR